MSAKGPLSGVRVVEFAGIGPGPFCAMMLADMGAEVIRIDREGAQGSNPVLERGRARLNLDLKSPEGRERALAALEKADVLVEGFRPGVMERLGLGPDEVLARNPRMIYGRMTGWGQTGPLAHAAGHDINYIALTGALAAIGKPGQPAQPPLNLVGDFGGGGMYLAFGIAAALYERERSGKGQVIDAAIVDGTASLMAMFSGTVPAGHITVERDTNLLGGAAPYYRAYLCADGKEVAIGALEPQFYAELTKLIGAEPVPGRGASAGWPGGSNDFAAIFVTKTQAEWCAILEGTDACFAPVLTLAEAPGHPHMSAREIYPVVDGIAHPAPAPRFSRTPGDIQPGDRDGEAVLKSWGVMA